MQYIDNLMPWEKEIYVNLLVSFLKEVEYTSLGLYSKMGKFLLSVVGLAVSLVRL